MLSISKFFKKESKPAQPSDDLERLKKRFDKFDGNHFSYERHFTALSVWESKVDDLVKKTPINEETSKQIARIYTAIADRQLDLFDNTSEQHQHPMQIENNLNRAKGTYQKALEHKNSLEIASIIESIDEDLQDCDQTAPTYVANRGEVTWAEAKEISAQDPSRHIKPIIPEKAKVYDIQSGAEISDTHAQPALAAHTLAISQP